DDIDQVMNHRGALFRSWLPGGDVHPTIDLTGVSADDFDRNSTREGDCGRRLADAGRPRDHQEGNPHAVRSNSTTSSVAPSRRCRRSRQACAFPLTTGAWSTRG